MDMIFMDLWLNRLRYTLIRKISQNKFQYERNYKDNEYYILRLQHRFEQFVHRLLALQRLLETRFELLRWQRTAARFVHQTDFAVGRGNGDARRRKALLFGVRIGDDDSAVIIK